MYVLEFVVGSIDAVPFAQEAAANSINVRSSYIHAPNGEHG